VDDVLDRALGVRELAGDLRGVEPIGQQPQHVALTFGETGGSDAARGEHVALEPAHLGHQPPEKVGSEGAVTRRC
jgi:hypothetical protein